MHISRSGALKQMLVVFRNEGLLMVNCSGGTLLCHTLMAMARLEITPLSDMIIRILK